MAGRQDNFLYARVGMPALVAGGLLGAIVWAAHQNVSYALTYWACEQGEMWPFYLATFIAVLVVAAASAVSWMARPSKDAEGEGRAVRRARFIGTVSTTFGAISVAGILIESIPFLVLDPCMGAT